MTHRAGELTAVKEECVQLCGEGELQSAYKQHGLWQGFSNAP